jgi:Fic family protein
MSIKEINEYIKKNRNVFDKFMDCTEYDENFTINYTYNSNAIEGNKLEKDDIINLLKNKMVNKNININNVFEIINHIKAFDEVKLYASSKISLSEDMVKNIHHQLMENVMNGGFYRNHEVRILGAKHKPPFGNEMYSQIKNFFETLKFKELEMKPIELAAYTHAEFVKIHPFSDGNGRTSRLIMNYQLIKNGYLPINIPKEEKAEYFSCLDEYANNNNLKPFIKYIYKLEYLEMKEYLACCKDKKILKKK